MPENPFRSQLPAGLLLSALLAATIALIEPVKSAIGNWSEIGIGISTLLARLATPFAVAFVGIAAIAVLLTAITPRRAAPILAALYVALWAQGSLFVWEYGIFDGLPIDWNEHSGKGLVELTFWAAVLALALIKHEWIRRRWLPIAAIVFALQLAAIADQARRNPPIPESSDSETAIVDAQEVRSVSLYSRELNVILIVLDGLQSDFFSESMRDPGLRAAMPPGFTYYRNATSVYSSTPNSLYSIFTSKMLNREGRVVSKAQSLPTRLAEQGFDAMAITFNHRFLKPRYWGYRYVTSATLAGAGSASTAWREDVSDMFALGTFRLSPHFLKRRIYDDGQWRTPRLYPLRSAVSRDPKIDHRTRMDLAVFDELIASTSAGNTAPQFRFLHFFGTHRPFTVDEKCGHLPNGSPRKRVVAMTHCILSRLYEFLHKLDEIGAYDRSLIFVVGDHGSWRVPIDVSTAMPRIPENVEPNDAAHANDATLVNWHGRAVPAFLAKSFGDRHALRISDVPVSLCDIPKSVMDTLAIENDFECESVFSVGTPRHAARIVHFRHASANFRRTRLGLPPEHAAGKFAKFKVIGHSWLPESWVHFVVDAE